ncbi:hypothetical protein BU24DRAFT_424608 [Aaosphaeria arxii CBS 175.79]|uniref:N-acetyltransferase domain-containing protein n=1 Tax=Aaosphaeria arxii CBS 175.79 TaxID=1450172 RepID=A0A6A5XLI7_9PLEO|nr:uncharacterized protein BU24DRAFT_424608 [Aaosphaeria arxii CBS 175.79]KAF2013610.1 hypothetical protein BU24DRAFT_424608 [Aaosphaeria arxii CBS 175.79]
MPLEIHPMTSEADFADFARIQLAAFKSGIAFKLVPRPIADDYVPKNAAKHKKSVEDEPDLRFIKVVDTDLGGKMIAGAKWRINEKERTEEQIQIQLPNPEKDAAGPAAKEFLEYLRTVRLKYMGTKPFYFLHILATDPDHERRGAGALLIKWGTEQADKAKLPSFLEASREGKPLYQRQGFQPVFEQTFNLEAHGGVGTDQNTAMIREPQQ